jgi:hypothetical protein
MRTKQILMPALVLFILSLGTAPSFARHCDCHKYDRAGYFKIPRTCDINAPRCFCFTQQSRPGYAPFRVWRIFLY